MRITIDPGHGEKGNQYPPRPNFYEGTQMWKLSQYLGAELQKRGFDITNTRPKITDNPELADRGGAAAKNGSVMFVSLHSNAPASATDTGPTGSVLFYSVKGPQHKALAEKLVTKVSEVMGHYSRGAQAKKSESNPANDYYGVIRAAANGGCTCAMLIEHGFHTNPKDAAFLTDDASLQKLAVAEAEIIAAYFGNGAADGGNGTTGTPTLKKGDSGEAVKTLQSKLMVAGYTLAVDGSFGPATEEAVKSFQKGNGLTVDGVCGPQTWAALAGAATATGSTDEETIWNFLKGNGLNAYAIAGLMGNLFAESGLRPNNLQNTFETKLGHTDASYTAAVDNGTYTNFVNDSAGYGLAQWTYYSRKEALLKYAKEAKTSIGNLTMQLGFLWKELQGYTAVMKTLNCAASVREASDVVLLQYERPADQSEAVQIKRAGYAQTYYDKFAEKTAPTPAPAPGGQMYRVRKTWEDSKSQIGAYTVLDNAKAAADEKKAEGYKVFDASGKAVYDPAAVPEKSPIEITVDNAIADGVLADRAHWLGVLDGSIKGNPEHIKTVFDRYHEKLKG